MTARVVDIALICIVAAILGIAIAKPFEIDIVHVGGIKGQVPERSFRGTPWGGMARVKSVLDRIDKAAKGNRPVLKIGHGKLFGAEVFDHYFHDFSSNTEREPVIELVESFEFTETGLGQHDLYYGPTYFSTALSRTNISCISSNAVISGEHPLSKQIKPYIVKEIVDSDGVTRRIGIVSTAEPKTCESTTCRGNYNGKDVSVSFSDPATALKAAIAAMKKEHKKVDLIIANILDNTLDNIKKLAQTVKGVGVFLSGDDVHLADVDIGLKPQGKYPMKYANGKDNVLHASVAGETLFVGHLSVKVNDNGVPESWAGSVIPLRSCGNKPSNPAPLAAYPSKPAPGKGAPVNPSKPAPGKPAPVNPSKPAPVKPAPVNPSKPAPVKPAPVKPAPVKPSKPVPVKPKRRAIQQETCENPDEEIKRKVDALVKRVNDRYKEVHGKIKNPLPMTMPQCRFEECAASLMAVDAIHWRNPTCDISLLNTGGFRSGFKKGNYTSRAVYEAIPFSNLISTISLKGVDLLDVLQHGVDRVPSEPSREAYQRIKDISTTGQYLTLAGLQVKYDASRPSASKIVDASVFDRVDREYKKLGIHTWYTVCLPDFMLNGGDGYRNIRRTAKRIAEGSISLQNTIHEYILQFKETNSDINIEPKFGRLQRVQNQKPVFFCQRDCNHHGRCIATDKCECDPGWIGLDCGIKKTVSIRVVVVSVVSIVFILVGSVGFGVYRWRRNREKRSNRKRVLLDASELSNIVESDNGCSAVAKYKNEKVYVSYMQPDILSQTEKGHLLKLTSLHHNNIVNFIGLLVDPCCMLLEYGSVGSLDKALSQQTLPKDIDLLCSIALDITRGINYLHSRGVSHGMLMPSCMIIRSDFTCKITNFQVHSYLLQPEPIDLLLWLAPEILEKTMPGIMEEDFVNRIMENIFATETIDIQNADVYGYGMCLFALVTYNPYPWGEKIHTLPSEIFKRESTRISIIAENKRPQSIDREIMIKDWEWELGGREFTIYDISRRCLESSRSNRPSLVEILDTIEDLAPKVANVMAHIQEKYTAHLEEVVSERTKQLELEKREVEHAMSSIGNLLSRIVPDDVLCRLQAGYSCVSDTYENGVVCIIKLTGFSSYVYGNVEDSMLLLNSIFAQLGEIAKECGIAYTLADAGEYVCATVAGSLYENSETMIFFALKALHKVKHLIPENVNITVTAAVTSGKPVHAGIVGQHIIRYTIFGSSVDKAREFITSQDILADHLVVNSHISAELSGHDTMSFKASRNGMFIVENDNSVVTAEFRTAQPKSTTFEMTGREKLSAAQSLLSGAKFNGTVRGSCSNVSVDSTFLRKLSVVSSASSHIARQKRLGVAKRYAKDNMISEENDNSSLCSNVFVTVSENGSENYTLEDIRSKSSSKTIEMC